LSEIRGSRVAFPDSLRHAIAIHEAGHVLVARTIGGFDVSAVSIDDAGGMTRIKSRPNEIQTLSGLESLMTMLLGGRAAEMEVLPPEDLTAGAGAGAGDRCDLARCTAIAVDIECRFGLGESGLAYLPNTVIELALHNPEVLARVEQRLGKCLGRARAILATRRAVLLSLAAEIGRRGHLSSSEIDAALQLGRGSAILAPGVEARVQQGPRDGCAERIDAALC
jgi:ATP-dependent Zn protease